MKKDQKLAPLQLSSEEIARRKSWLSLGQADEQSMRTIDDAIADHVDEIVDDMYQHFLSFAETRSFFPNQEVIDRARSAQSNYFKRLAKGGYDDAYVSERLRVGDTHHRIGLDPKWYLGAYCLVLNRWIEYLHNFYKDDPDTFLSACRALEKVIFFDLGLAIESHIDAKEKAMGLQQNAIAELRAERRAINSMLENAPMAIVRLDRDFRILECNDEFLTLVDKSRDQIVRLSLFEAAPSLTRDPFYRVVSEGVPSKKYADLLYFTINSALNYWDWVSWPVKDENGDISGLVAMFTVATDRVMLQQQREDFVATLTHDLKTPILAANRAVKLLMDGDFGPVSDGQRKVLETLFQSNDATYKMVQTLLDVYRYDSGAKQLTFGLHYLPDTLRSLTDELQPLAGAKNIELNCVVPNLSSSVRCDLSEIRRVVQNFMDNSLKFTPKGGRITVRLEQTETATVVSVSDTGKGISDEDKPKLFQRFWQAASSGRYYASTGLGLYLCRQIVEAHGGKIWCWSKLGEGSTFAFILESNS